MGVRMKRAGVIFVGILLAASFASAIPQGWIEQRVSRGDPGLWDNSFNTQLFRDSAGARHIVWAYLRQGAHFDIRHATITDNSAQITEITPNRPGAQHDPQVAVLPNYFFIAWTDNELSNGRNSQIVMQRVNNQGITQGLQRVISNNNVQVANAQEPSIAVDNNNIRIVWADNRNGNYDIYYSKHDQFGDPISGLGNIRLTTNSGDSLMPSVTVNQDNTFNVVWADNQDGIRRLYFARLSDSGTRVINDIRLPTYGDNPEGVMNLNSVLGNDGSLFIVWEELTSTLPLPFGTAGVFVQRINPVNGQIITQFLQISTGIFGNTVTAPTLVPDNMGNIYAAFSEGRFNSGMGHPLYLQKYDISTNELRSIFNLQLTNDYAISDFSSLLFDGQEVHIAFVNTRNDVDGEVFYARSAAEVVWQDIRENEQGAMVLRNTLWSRSYVQAALALGDTPGFDLTDGRHIPLNPDPLFWLTITNTPMPMFPSTMSGRLNGEGKLRLPVIPPEGSRDARIYGAFVVYEPNQPQPAGIKFISKAFPVAVG